MTNRRVQPAISTAADVEYSANTFAQPTTKRNDISVIDIPEDVVLATNDAFLRGEERFEVSDNIFEVIDKSHRRNAERQKQYDDISVLRLAGMKAEEDGNTEDAIVKYAEAIRIGEASDFDLLHAYRHAYNRIIILLSRTHAYECEADYIEQLLKRHTLQDRDRTRLEERLRKTYIKINK